MLLNCGVREDSWEYPGLQGDQTNQSWIFTGRLILKLKLPYFGHLMRRANSFQKTLMLRNIEGRRRRGRQRMRWLECNTYSIDMSLSKPWEMVKGREAWCAAVHGVTKGWTWLSNWSNKPLQWQQTRSGIVSRKNEIPFGLGRDYMSLTQLNT